MDRAVPQAEPTHTPPPPDFDAWGEVAIPRGMRLAQFRAMGTTVALLLPQAQARAGEATVRALFDEWERTLSRFRPASELSRLNARAGTSVAVGGVLFSALETALDAARATGGVYDPTLLEQITRLGYDRSFEQLQPDAPPAPAGVSPGGGWRRIRLERATRRVTLPAGVGVDLGGIAKGMAVDAALAQLRLGGVRAALVNAGGDLAAFGLPPGAEEWSIAAPLPGASWRIPLRSGAVATSSNARRRWRQGGATRHHLLDPQSGLPAESGLCSVTVVAERCAQAEVAAKVAFVLGAERGAAFLAQHGLHGLLAETAGGWRRIGELPGRLESPQGRAVAAE